MQTKHLPKNYDCLAPDGSEIRLLTSTARGSSVHCTLPAGKVSLAVTHRGVEEIWYVLEGRGELWRKLDGREETIELRPGVSATIPLGSHFQFRNSGPEPLCLLITTMPPWPGEDEARRVSDHWPAE